MRKLIAHNFFGHRKDSFNKPQKKKQTRRRRRNTWMNGVGGTQIQDIQHNPQINALIL